MRKKKKKVSVESDEEKGEKKNLVVSRVWYAYIINVCYLSLSKHLLQSNHPRVMSAGSREKKLFTKCNVKDNAFVKKNEANL